jgi:nicotinamidase-related amidase
MASNTALLVIDMQVGIVANGHDKDGVIGRIADLATAARAAGTPVIYVQHEEDWPTMHRGESGWQITPALTPAAGEPTIFKRACDAFYDTTLRDELTARGVQKLIITGMMTDACIDTTCRRASSEGFDVTLVADGHTTEDAPDQPAARTIAYHNRILAQMAQPDHPIVVRPSAEIAF